MITDITLPRFTMHVHAHVIPNRLIEKTNPVFIYEVEDNRGEPVALISNLRATTLNPLWKVSPLGGRKLSVHGEYATARAAFEAFCRTFKRTRPTPLVR
jgi:hypothetical protein